MKALFYRVFALLFHLSRLLFPVKPNRVVFLSLHNEGFHDSLGAVSRAVMADGRFAVRVLTRRDLDGLRGALRFFFVASRVLATAQYIFLNDNFLPLGLLRFQKGVVITQLWHAEGVFKKFGLAIDRPPAVRARECAANQKLTWVVCSSEDVAPYYAEAFGVPESKVLPLGAPRLDALLAPGASERARAKLCEQYPELRGKTLVLYAPTFRETAAQNDALLTQFDAARFNAALGKTHALLIRLHPQVHPDRRALTGALDLTDFDDVSLLIAACDVLVTDYSSICMAFAALGKPTVFYAFDLDRYTSERDFYFDYADYVPGPVVTDFDALLDAIKAPGGAEKRDRFVRFNFGVPDAGSTRRVVDRVLGTMENEE
ncbi:MAG: CDP-glycerol glycerophosphotransferase family protein [Clostridia bacterium]|nr:CDP-glycerol glycerophosphotransferase family protein [Clostridia bacterium]